MTLQQRIAEVDPNQMRDKLIERPFVLLYHRVEEESQQSFGRVISPVEFRAQITFLKANFRIVPLSAMADELRNGRTPHRTVCITFDEGYESVGTVAKPILEELAAPATVFLNMNFIGGQLFWWDRCVALLGQIPGPPKPDRELLSAPDDGEAPDREPTGIWRRLRKLPAAAREIALDRLARSFRIRDQLICPRPMSEWQAAQLVTGGLVDIGAHGRTSSYLTLLDREDVAEEVRGSKRDLEDFFGRPVELFAYPFGDFNATTQALVADAGFKCACAKGTQLVDRAIDILALPRIEAPPTAADLRGLIGTLTGLIPAEGSADRLHRSAWAGPDGDEHDGDELPSALDTFVGRHRSDIRNPVLETGEPFYTAMFGVSAGGFDVLDINPANPSANLIVSLQSAEGIPDATYNCVLLTEFLDGVSDLERTVQSLVRILKPSGVLILAVESRRGEVPAMESESLRELLARWFNPLKIVVETYENPRTRGRAIAARAVKSAAEPVRQNLRLPAIVSTPMVSIVIPLFNSDRTIAQTIDSVLTQDLDHWEMIIFNDSSKDRSLLVASHYAERFPNRILALSSTSDGNKGPSYARNQALRFARGDFISFLDSDDTLLPGKLSHDVQILKKNPEAAAVVGRTLWWWDDRSMRPARVDRIMAPGDRVYHPPVFFEETFVRRTVEVPCIHSWMLRRGALAAVDRFDVELATYEDQKMLAALSRVFPIYVSGQCLVEYRRREDSLWPAADRAGPGLTAQRRFQAWLDSLQDT
jgi:peptidoglycan/xylan/chitin deacetylase (PgdA/CDA1 family)